MAKPPKPAPLPALVSVAPRTTLDSHSAAANDFLDLPARPGVAILQNASGAAALIATTADLRDFARRKLGAPQPDDPKRPRTDHRAIASHVIAIEAASSLEAEAIYLHEARARMPATHRIVSERWRAWFLHIDPDAEHPQWSKTNLVGLVAPRSASTARGSGGDESNALPPGLLIGPIADKDTAGRLIERVIDAFDLCRYHNLLVQSPRAVACAYKEMGRCPAPCDGSESLADYRARVRHAASFLTGDRESTIADVRARMTAAASAHDYAQAATLKNALTRFESLATPAFSLLADLRSWSLLVILPTSKPKLFRCLAFTNLELTHAGDLNLDAAPEPRAAEIAAAVLASLTDNPASPTPAHIDTIAAVSRYLRQPAKSRRGESIPLTLSSTPTDLAAQLLATARRLSRRKSTPATEPAIEERELEILPVPPT